MNFVLAGAGSSHWSDSGSGLAGMPTTETLAATGFPSWSTEFTTTVPVAGSAMSCVRVPFSARVTGVFVGDDELEGYGAPALRAVTR